MTVILFIYHYINVLFGLTNISYNPLNDNYKLNQWPVILYTAILNMISLLLLHFCVYFYYDKLSQSLEKISLTPLDIIYISLFVTQYLCFLTSIGESWLKRKSLLGIFKKYKQLQKYCACFKKNRDGLEYNDNTRKILLIKGISFILQFVAFLYSIKEKYYNTPDWDVPDLIMNHIINCVFIGFMELCSILVNANIYIGFYFIYTCIQNLTQHLRQILKDIEKINHWRHYHFLNNSSVIKEYLEKFMLNILEVANFEQELNVYILEFIHVFKFQIILQLLILFASNLTLLFNIFFHVISVAFFNDSFENIAIIQLISYGILYFVANILSCILFFNICELLSTSFKEMRYWAYRIISYTSLECKELFSKDDLIHDVSKNSLKNSLQKYN